jgi:hypothetical protein
VSKMTALNEVEGLPYVSADRHELHTVYDILRLQNVLRAKRS